MPSTLTKNYLHIVFSTKNRQPFLETSKAPRIFEYMSGICKSLDCPTIAVGGYLDHIHILCMLSKSITLSALVQQVKVASTKWIKSEFPELKQFSWQEGFGAFSVEQNNVERVSAYVQNQVRHHQKREYKAEFRAFLDYYNIEYKEEYVWG